MDIHLLRVFLAGVGGFVAYFAAGTLLFVGMPWLKTEFKKYPNVYREEADLMKVMPIGMLAMFVAILALAALYAHMTPWGSGLMQGAAFGVLIGVFALGSFVIHNHVNLRIGWSLTLQSGIAYFIEWIAVGVAIGLIYR